MIPPKISAMHDALQALVNYVLQTRPSKKECKKCIGHGFLSHVKSQLDSCSQQNKFCLECELVFANCILMASKCTMLSVLQICRLKINHFPDFVSGPPMQYVPPASIDRLSQKSQKLKIQQRLHKKLFQLIGPTQKHQASLEISRRYFTKKRRREILVEAFSSLSSWMSY